MRVSILVATEKIGASYQARIALRCCRAPGKDTYDQHCGDLTILKDIAHFVILRTEHEPTRIAVQTMHDARAGHRPEYERDSHVHSGE